MPRARWITAHAFARYVMVSPRTMYRWIRSGVIPAGQVMKGGHWRIHEADARTFLERVRTGRLPQVRLRSPLPDDPLAA